MTIGLRRLLQGFVCCMMMLVTIMGTAVLQLRSKQACYEDFCSAAGRVWFDIDLYPGGVLIDVAEINGDKVRLAIEDCKDDQDHDSACLPQEPADS